MEGSSQTFAACDGVGPIPNENMGRVKDISGSRRAREARLVRQRREAGDVVRALAGAEGRKGKVPGPQHVPLVLGKHKVLPEGWRRARR